MWIYMGKTLYTINPKRIRSNIRKHSPCTFERSKVPKTAGRVICPVVSFIKHHVGSHNLFNHLLKLDYTVTIVDEDVGIYRKPCG